MKHWAMRSFSNLSQYTPEIKGICHHYHDKNQTQPSGWISVGWLVEQYSAIALTAVCITTSMDTNLAHKNQQVN